MELNFKRNLLHNSLKRLCIFICISMYSCTHIYIEKEIRKGRKKEERRERLSQQILRM